MHIFQPNCTFPQTRPAGFINNPSIRSTLDVVWSCTSIIILSTWSILHLTVPPDIIPRSKFERFQKEVYSLKRKLSWMFVMLMFPEYLLAIGAANLLVARMNSRVLQDLAKEDNVPWSLTHTILADMGGIAIRFPAQKSASGLVESLKVDTNSTEVQNDNAIEPANPVDDFQDTEKLSKTKEGSSVTRIEHVVSPNATKFLKRFEAAQESDLDGLGTLPWTPCRHHMALISHYREHHPIKQHGHAFVRHALKKLGLEDKLQKVTSTNHLAPLHGNIWVLDSKHLIIPRQGNIINQLPNIRLEEIEDKSKSDGLVRLLALIQVLWLIVQLMVRLIIKLSASALEISTLAFAVCAVIIYLIEWEKAKDVAVPVYIDTANVFVAQDTFNAVAEAAPTVFLRDRHYTMPQSCVHQLIDNERWKPHHIDQLIVWLSVFSTSLFGGLHMLAWNLEFPTHTELVLWRAAALSVATVPSVCALMVLYESIMFGSTHTFSVLSVIVFAPLYLSSRVYLLVESFRSLYYLPLDALTETWVTYAPHIS